MAYFHHFYLRQSETAQILYERGAIIYAPPCIISIFLFYFRLADTWCDDENNNIGCHFDGGDCCGNNVKKTFCTECQCKACGVNHWYEILNILNGPRFYTLPI